MKKILLLGGSSQQIPAIQAAKNKGYETILCDYLPNNPGQYYSDKFHCISTTDKEAVLKVAKDYEIDGIVAYASDPAAPTAAYVAEQLGLPTNPFKSVEILSNKEKFRNFLSKNNFNTPKAKAYSTIEDVKRDIDGFKLPVIIKPVDSSGSKGVSKLENISNLSSQFEEAMKYSRIKKVIIEEYVDMIGYQVAGDGFSLNGKLKFRCFANDHFNKKGKNIFVPISASFPYVGTEKLQAKIHSEIQRLLDLLEMKTGAYNFDVRVDEKENVYLMEVGPRNGGNYIPQVIKYATGVDLLDLSIRAAMGEDCSEVEMVKPSGYWSYFAIHSSEKGILKSINIKEKVKQNNIVESFMNYKIGDEIPSFTGANTSIGILLMRFTSMEEMLNMMDNPNEWIEVEVF